MEIVILLMVAAFFVGTWIGIILVVLKPVLKLLNKVFKNG